MVVLLVMAEKGTQHNIYQVELLDYHMLEEDMKLLRNLREREDKLQIKVCSNSW